MNASPSWCSSGPQNRIGMRLEPAWASISAKCALRTLPASSSSSPGSSPDETRTPWISSSPRTTFTSLMSGTSRSTLTPSDSSAATIALVTRFLAPRTSTSPKSGTPPSIVKASKVSPTLAPARRASVMRLLKCAPAMFWAANARGRFRIP